MAAFELIAALGMAAGLGVAAWMALPTALAKTEETPKPDVFTTGDVARRLAVLHERAIREDDDPRPWTLTPLVVDGPRLPSALMPARQVVLLGDDVLLPLHAALLTIIGGDDVVRGRRQGRPIHAIRLHDDLYIDLVEALRLLPVIGLELAARKLHGDARLLPATDLTTDVQLVAPWLLTGDGPRITSEDAGERVFQLSLAGRVLTTRVWMPTVIGGLSDDSPRAAGEILLDGHRCTGATSHEDLTALGLQASPPIGWTRVELLELAAVLQQLESQGVDVSPLLLEVFADRRGPMPDLHDERQALVTSAVLNWVGAAHRRAGRPRAALAALEAALRVSAPTDDDNRGDIEHNRGLAWLDLHAVDDSALHHATAAFTNSARLHPTDAAPWVQLALVHTLNNDASAAEDAWLQAATHAPDTDHYSLFMANAGARPTE